MSEIEGRLSTQDAASPGEAAHRDAPSADVPPAAPDGEATAGARMVPAVERAARLLDRLAASRRPATLAELSRELALPKSSLHGLLGTLAALDLVQRLPDGSFTLGPHVLHWASGYTLQSDVAGAFNAYAGEDGPLAAETVMLAVLDGADVVYLACRPGTRPLAVNFRVGGRFPASCTSSGKAMLSTMSEARVRAQIGDAPLPRLTRHSLADHATLMRQLAQARRDGLAMDDEETAVGMHCFGAPVFAAQADEAVAAVAVSAIKASVTPARERELADGIRALAARLSARLGAGTRPRLAPTPPLPGPQSAERPHASPPAPAEAG